MFEECPVEGMVKVKVSEEKAASMLTMVQERIALLNRECDQLQEMLQSREHEKWGLQEGLRSGMDWEGPKEERETFPPIDLVLRMTEWQLTCFKERGWCHAYDLHQLVSEQLQNEGYVMWLSWEELACLLNGDPRFVSLERGFFRCSGVEIDMENFQKKTRANKVDE